MEEVYSFLPIWGWHPVWVFLFVLGVDWGAIMAIRILIERKTYLSRWWTFRVGDVIGLPLYAVAAAVVVDDFNHPDAFYQQVWWHVLWLAVGFGLSLTIQVRGLLTGFFDWKTVLNPSEMYHTAVFGVMFYLMLSIAAPVLADRQPTGAFLLAAVGMGIYIACYVVDQTSLVDKSPDRRPAFWEVLRREPS